MVLLRGKRYDIDFLEGQVDTKDNKIKNTKGNRKDSRAGAHGENVFK